MPDGSDVGAASRTAVGSVDTNIALMASPQRYEISDELIELRVVELHRGHEGTRLERARVFHPGAEVFGRVSRRAGAQCRAAHQMRQVRAEHAVARRAAYGMAVDAGQRGEQLTPRPGRFVLRRRALLLGDPGPKLGLRMPYHDQQKH